MDTRSYAVTPQQLDGLAAYLKGQGLAFDPTAASGNASEHGWNVSWTILDGELTIYLIAHPFLEAGAFWSKVENLLKPS